LLKVEKRGEGGQGFKILNQYKYRNQTDRAEVDRKVDNKVKAVK
jgi:hypothetical protein